jgi:hypothetical protein
MKPRQQEKKIRSIKGNTSRVLERGIQVARDLNEFPSHDDRFSMEEAEVKKKEIKGNLIGKQSSCNVAGRPMS